MNLKHHSSTLLNPKLLVPAAFLVFGSLTTLGAVGPAQTARPVPEAGTGCAVLVTALAVAWQLRRGRTNS